MSPLLVIVAMIVIVLFMVTELATAILPMIIAVTLVAPSERQGVAELLAAADSSRRLRFWQALRLAVAANRQHRRKRDHRKPAMSAHCPECPLAHIHDEVVVGRR